MNLNRVIVIFGISLIPMMMLIILDGYNIVSYTIRDKKISIEQIQLFETLPEKCGKSTHSYVCDSDIESLPIGHAEQEIMKEYQDYIQGIHSIIWMFIVGIGIGILSIYNDQRK